MRMIVDVMCEEDKALPSRLVEALRLLEDDALGGGGSRGSGRVACSNLSVTWRGRAFYASGAAESALATGLDLAGLQALLTGADFAGKLAE